MDIELERVRYTKIGREIDENRKGV
jgi:hypothetical protein